MFFLDNYLDKPGNFKRSLIFFVAIFLSLDMVMVIETYKYSTHVYLCSINVTFPLFDLVFILLADFYQPFKEDELEQSTEVQIIFPSETKPVGYKMRLKKKKKMMHIIVGYK